MIIVLLITGTLVGILSSFFGVGGGIIAVPTLYHLLPEVPPQTVISSSLAMIFVNSILNVYNFTKAGQKVKFSLILPMFPGIILGILIGSLLTDYMQPRSIKIFFATAVLLIGIRTWFSPAQKNGDQELPVIDSSYRIIGFLTAIFSGIIAGLTGLGGGAILVPLFITFLHFPFRLVAFYSNILMIAATGTGIIGHMLKNPETPIFFHKSFSYFQVGYVNWGIVLCLFTGAFFTSKYGVKLSQEVRPETAKKLFCLLLISVALKIYIKSFSLFS